MVTPGPTCMVTPEYVFMLTPGYAFMVTPGYAGALQRSAVLLCSGVHACLLLGLAGKGVVQSTVRERGEEAVERLVAAIGLV